MIERRRSYYISGTDPNTGQEIELPLADWSRVLGIPYTRLHQRVCEGLPDAEVLRQADRRQTRAKRIEIDGTTLTVPQWSKLKGIPYNTIQSRLRRGLTGRAIVGETK